MNWKILFLVLFTLQHVYTLVLHIVQRRSANNPIPLNVADVYNLDTYRSWKAYHADNNRLAVLRTLASWVLTMTMLGLDVYARVAARFPEGAFMQLLAVLLTSIVTETLVFVGFSWVQRMVIEQKYGFNRSTPKTFVFDQIRSLLIELVVSVALTGLLALIYTAVGDWMILIFTGAIFALTLAIAFLYGPVFSRLGNKFVPLEDGELKDKLLALLGRHGYQVKAIEVMDASRRTTKLNAYFTGFGKLKSIVLYDNLVQVMSTDEICAVFAHELGHGLHKDVLKQQIMNLGNLLLMSAVVWLTVRTPAMHEAFGFVDVNYGFAFILLSGLLGLVQPLTGMAMNAFTRHAEYRADAQAVKEGYGPYLIAGLKKLAKENFVHLAPAKLLVLLEYSHPPLSKRIEAIERHMTLETAEAEE